MPDIEQMVRVYRRIRDKRSDLKDAFKQEDDVLKAKLEMIENALMAHFNATKTTTHKTDDGTAYISETTKASFSDWEAAIDWMKREDCFEYLTHSVAVKAVTDYIREHGEPPPGIRTFKERNVRVRAPKPKK